jgi:hypothetical protein
MGNGSDVWEMLVENVPSTLCGDRRARAGGPDKIRPTSTKWQPVQAQTATVSGLWQARIVRLTAAGLST